MTVSTVRVTARCACGQSYERGGLVVAGQSTIYTAHRCPACQGAFDATVAQRLAEDRQRDQETHRDILLRDLAVPPLYADATIETFRAYGTPEEKASQMRALQLCRRLVAAWPPDTMTYALVGPPGTGKTHLIWGIAKAVVTAWGGTARVVKLSAMIRDLRGAWNRDGGPDEETRLHKYRSPDLLVIDEVSRHAFYGKEIFQHLYDVVDDRIQYRRVTLLTSNEDDAGLNAILGPALIDRLQGDGGVIRCRWSSYRTRPLEAQS
jgi:DNA replication protein DnaC